MHTLLYFIYNFYLTRNRSDRSDESFPVDIFAILNCSKTRKRKYTFPCIPLYTVHRIPSASISIASRVELIPNAVRVHEQLFVLASDIRETINNFQGSPFENRARRYDVSARIKRTPGVNRVAKDRSVFVLIVHETVVCFSPTLAGKEGIPGNILNLFLRERFVSGRGKLLIQIESRCVH